MKKMESIQKNITHGLLARLVVIMAFLLAGAIGTFAAVGPYVVFDSDAKTMTFKYGEQPTIDNVKCFTLNSKTYVPNWSNKDEIKKNVTTVVFDKSFASASPTTCRSWFNGFSQLTEIKGIKNLNTSEVRYMSYMFAGCSKLKSVDLTYMNLQNVEDMSYMFNYCLVLKMVYLKGLNTSNVKNMKSMFELCKSLEHLDLSSFDTQKVKNFQRMFYECNSLKAIYASPKFVVNVSDLDSKANMFYRCYNLAGESMTYNPAHVNGDYAKFVYGYFLDATYLRPWVKQNDKTITLYYGYKKTPGTGEYELDEWLNKNKDKSKPFTKATFDESFALYQPISCEDWFYDYLKLEEIENLHYLNTSKVTTMHGMFFHCNCLKSLDLSAFETSNVKDFAYLFYSCKRLESLNVSSFDTSAATNMQAMFTYCEKLKTIDLTNFETANVKRMGYMFSGCTNMKAVIVGSKFTNNKANCEYMFKDTPAQLYSHIDDYLANTGNKTFAYGYISRSIKPYFPVNDKAEYGTLCSPVGGTLGDGTFIGFDKLYEVDADRTDKTAVKLKQVTKIEAGKPYIYHRDLTADTPVAAAVSFDATDAKASAPVNSGMMRGSFKSITALAGSYILQTDGMFHRVANGNKSLKVGAYRAYLDMSKVGSEAKTVTMSFDDETTGITDVNAPADEPADTPIYDLSGRRISSPQKGQIFIFKGKKRLKP